MASRRPEFEADDEPPVRKRRRVQRHRAEEVLFKSPEEHIVRLQNVARGCDVAALAQRLGKYGVFQRSRLVPCENGDFWDFYVHYYTESSREDALQGLDGNSFGDVPVMANRGSGTGETRKLGRDDCVDLANHLLGFDGWSHRIVALGEQASAPVHGAAFSASYKAVVGLTFAIRDDIEVRGEAEGECEGANVGDVLAGAKKRAINHALEQAFSGVAICVQHRKAIGLRVVARPGVSRSPAS